MTDGMGRLDVERSGVVVGPGTSVASKARDVPPTSEDEMTQAFARAARRRYIAATAVAALSLFGASACATLKELIQPLQFSSAPGQQAEVRLFGPSAQRPLGGIGVRMWARVQNPNPLGVNLTRITGNLFLSNNQAGSVDLPLGLALQANGETTFPVDVSISFSDIPGLANVLRSALTGSAIPYRLDGRFAVDAGSLGTFDFGPQTLLRGNATVLR